VYNRKSFYALTIAFGIASTLNAHATLRTSDDSKLQADVQTSLNNRPDLGALNSIRAQSVNHVVYLTGLVDTSQEKWIAESIASQTPGVVGVVNSIEQNN
jgi:osmotically-inducible protein OsmY